MLAAGPQRLCCFVDAAGNMDLADPMPYRVGMLLTCFPDRLGSDIRSLKREMPPRSRSGEFHASEDRHPVQDLLRLLILNDEPRLHIVELRKEDFAPPGYRRGKLRVARDCSAGVAAFVLPATSIAIAAVSAGFPMIEFIVENSSSDPDSEHRALRQAFNGVFRTVLERVVSRYRAPAGNVSAIAIGTRRKRDCPELSFVDHWLWAYSRSVDRGESDVFPPGLAARTTVEVMRPPLSNGSQSGPFPESAASGVRS
jgi:hypothetical protein